MGRKKQNPEDSAKRALILKRANELFMTQSYGALSMDALAQAVPVSKRTLYNHFKDKKAIFTAVMEGRCKTAFEALEQTLRGDQSVKATLTAIGRQFVAIVFEPDAVNMYRTAITEARQFPELGKLFFESGPKRSLAFLTTYLKKAHQRGDLYVTDPELAANLFLSMLTNRTQMKCMLGLKKQVTAREKHAIVHQAVEIFLHGQQPRKRR